MHLRHKTMFSRHTSVVFAKAPFWQWAVMCCSGIYRLFPHGTGMNCGRGAFGDAPPKIFFSKHTSALLPKSPFWIWVVVVEPESTSSSHNTIRSARNLFIAPARLVFHSVVETLPIRPPTKHAQALQMLGAGVVQTKTSGNLSFPLLEAPTHVEGR